MQKGFILAAGKGTRVRPLTELVPKPLLPLVHQPVLEYLLEYLARQGLTEVVINTSYLAEQFAPVLGSGERYGVRIIYSYEGDVHDHSGWHMFGNALGSGGALRKVQSRLKYFDSTFPVLCGDALVDVDLHNVLAFHRERGALATIVTKTVSPAKLSSYGVVVATADGRVTNFQEKPQPHEALGCTVNTGIYLFEPEVVNYLPAGKSDIALNLFPTLLKLQAPIYAYNCDFNWFDIGSLADYWSVLKAIVRGQVPLVTLPGKRVGSMIVNPNTFIDPTALIEGSVYIGAGVDIEPQVHVQGPAIINDGCILRQGSSVRESYLHFHQQVREQEEVVQQIRFQHHRIPVGREVAH